MNRIERIALVAHEINRAYCASLGDNSQPEWKEAPEWQRKSAIAGVEMHLGNPDATPEQSHESWLAQKTADGWTYGETKDAEKKTHPCCVPYAELPPEQKAKDYLFRATVHQLKNIVSDALIALPVKVAPAIHAAATAGRVLVKYIGARPEWSDRLYGSGLSFTTGQERAVPELIASKLLKHVDLFEQGAAAESAQGESPAEDVSTDDTDCQIAAAKRQQEELDKELNRVQDIHDQVNSMEKDSLKEFAFTNFKQKLDMRKSVEDLRATVHQHIDQFGAV